MVLQINFSIALVTLDEFVNSVPNREIQTLVQSTCVCNVVLDVW